MKQEALKNLLDIYKNLYTYKNLLKGAPELTIDPNTLPMDDATPFLPTILQQTQAVIAHLLGLRQLPGTPEILDRINQHYKQNDFWRKLLLNYVDVSQSLDDDAFNVQREEVLTEGKNLFGSVESYIQKRKEIIQRFSAEIDKQNFPIDSKKLLTNYLNMAEKDPENAWNLLTTSPATFSPLKAVDTSGKASFSPAQAQKINHTIGTFIKKLKA